MINRYFYQSDVRSFLAEDTDAIFGKMSRADEMDTASTQKYAWEQEITIMKNVLAPYANEQAQIIFEYTIPRLGKRIDVVVLLRERVFVVEFKAGEEEYNHADVDQVLDYALDLKNFHQGSADRLIVPILVATESNTYSTVCQPSHYNDVRSSLFLEDAASEFDVQGLELDWTCVVWDEDLRYTFDGWNFFEFNGGNKWNKIQKDERRAYLINAYRVLLTRARQGMILCVPEGNPEDPTRLPEFYDSTYNYLKSLGFKEI